MYLILFKFQAIEYGAKTDLRSMVRQGSSLRDRITGAQSEFLKGWRDVREEFRKQK